MFKNVALVVLSVITALLILVVAGSGIAVFGARDQVIHAIGGKTGVEYDAIVSSLNKTKIDLNNANTELNKAKTDLDAANKEIGNLKGEIEKLNGKVSDLEMALGDWEDLLCNKTWAEATKGGNIFYLNTILNVPVRPTLNQLGIEVAVTQWKSTLDVTKPFNVLVVDVKGGVIMNVTGHCFIFKNEM